jgi:thiol peroxidase
MSVRKGAVTWAGNPADLEGPELKVGDTAPDFTVVGNDMKPLSLKDAEGRTLIIASVPSLDTGACDTESRRLNKEATEMQGVAVLVVSMDLPFAQKRWCGAAGAENLRTASDHREASFGKAYGVLQPDRRLLGRAVFLVDKQRKIRHVEYVPVTGDQPNFDTLIDSLKKVVAEG